MKIASWGAGRFSHTERRQKLRPLRTTSARRSIWRVSTRGSVASKRRSRFRWKRSWTRSDVSPTSGPRRVRSTAGLHPGSRVFQGMAIVAAALALSLAVACSVRKPPRTGTFGQDVYRHNCALCHGVDAGGADGPPLIDRQRSTEEVAAVVRSGGPRMPSFEGRLADPEITAVAEYVSNITRAAGPPTTP